MLNLAVQVSANPAGYLGNKKTKHGQHKENYFRDYYQKHRETLLNKKKARYLAQRSLLWSNYYTCKKPHCFACIQTGIKETEYKFCGDNCSVQNWITIYSKIHDQKEKERDQKEREKVNKKRRKGVEQFFPHTRNDSLNSPRSPVSRLRARFKNFVVFLFNTNQHNKQERRKRKDQPWRRLATKNKIAQTAGYNLPTYKEKRSIEELLKKHAEFAYLTGKSLGKYYLSTLDLDLRKVEFPERVVERLEKSIGCLLEFLRVSYDKTKKGLHIDILTPEPLPNEIIYYRGWGTVWNIGSIQSKGKYVVGEDKEKEFIKCGKWYWKAKDRAEIKAKLAKFFLMVGKRQEMAVDKSDRNIQLKKVVDKSTATQFIQAKILSKQKIPQLADFIKIWYKNLSAKQPSIGYFLLNIYQRPEALSILDDGSVRSVWLVSGRKYAFFGRARLWNISQWSTQKYPNFTG